MAAPQMAALVGDFRQKFGGDTSVQHVVEGAFLFGAPTRVIELERVNYARHVKRGNKLAAAAPLQFMVGREA